MTEAEHRLEWTFRDGTKTSDVIEWAMKFEEHAYRQVAEDRIEAPRLTVVSTIWQGLPPDPWGEPNAYETAVFDGAPPKAHLLWSKRWHTEDEAVSAHAIVAENVRRGWRPEHGTEPTDVTEEDLS
jgi:hypothetical protein